MKNDDARTPQALLALCRQAGEQAAGWGTDRPAGAAGPAAGEGAAVRRRRLLKNGAVGGCCLLALAVVAAQFADDAAPGTRAVPAVAQPLPYAAPPLPTAAAAGQMAPVHWHDGELVIDFDQLPLPQAVVLLAQATGTTVGGAQALQPVPVTLHLRTVDVDAAWRHLLQDHAGFSASCGAGGCRLSIAGRSPAAGVAAGDAAAPLRAADPVPQDGGPPHTESQPDGAC